MSADLRARVANAIARVTASRAADEVLAEIAKTHVLVPRELIERAKQANSNNKRSRIATELLRYDQEGERQGS